ncbi:Ribonuclease H-like superfamily [Sesbania bispinosa]|nr:Ribonuclease H-like superfamily [Sesbania bispinosa]
MQRVVGLLVLTRIWGTELRGVSNALEIAWDRGIKKLLCECDSSVSVNLIHNGTPDYHPYSFIHIREFLNRDWIVKIYHVWREANGVADMLARTTSLG